jgi:hypothetical protein
MIVISHATTHAQSSASRQEPLVLEKVIFHTGQCYGTCPQIDMEIDSNYNVMLKRNLYTKKGVLDLRRSGSFKGKVSPKTYFNLFATLVKSDYSNLKFPVNFCCDGAIITIIVYANGKRTYLSSMLPPKEARTLIDFLENLGTGLDLPSTKEEINVEK